MGVDNSAQVPSPGPELKRLGAFIGTWNTEGEIRASSGGPPIRIRATDHYEWLPGKFFLVHRWDADMPDGKTQGIEIIGYNEANRNYPMYSFDSQGNTGLMKARVEGDQWIFEGESLRFIGGFRDAGRTFAGLWEQRAGDGIAWLPWMDIALTKAKGESN